MTHTEIIYRRRLAACWRMPSGAASWPRPAGSSASRGPAITSGRTGPDLDGLDALMPKERRSPQMPSATPAHVLERLLTLAVSSPPSAVASTPIGSATRALPLPSRPCNSTWSTMGWAPGPKRSGPGRGDHGSDDGTSD